ncbi:aminoglycoside phosphotransferase family protein [Echinimonas agarilytica]|uniref:Phosphotransferase n=1 Tax=Echinimonas agarilytica TaxID=1215918 RepID=A0AA41WBK4_9GAMM|nr:phosphotransferase [Echinimonas agarilytica]MCM2681291.1 phosphotransferase [Echinimonas agarilytica]
MGSSSSDLHHRQMALTTWLRQALSNSDICLELVSGDASFRRYFRVLNHSQSAIAVDAPAPHENCELFLQVAAAYRKAGVRVPNVLAEDADAGFMCLEDFGDRLLLAEVNSSNCTELYGRSLDELIAIASVTQTCKGQLPAFNRAHLQRENALFTDWLLGTHLQLELSDAEQTMLEWTFDALIDNALSQPQTGVHRDYHARNIMLLEGDEVGIIDFQDAVYGAVTYDVVSLLRDCYIEWPDQWVDEMLFEWARKAVAQGVFLAPDPEQLRRWFDLMGIQRHVKASGIFCRLCHRDGKTGYLNDIPLTLSYIAKFSKRHADTVALAEFIEHRVMPAWEAKG